MLERALNSIKDDPNLTILNSNNINKNSTDKKPSSKLSDEMKFNSIMNEVKQDINMTDQVYHSLSNKSDQEKSGIFKENIADVSSPNANNENLEKSLEDLHTNIMNLENKLTSTNSNKVNQKFIDNIHKQNIKLDSDVLIQKIN